MNTAHEKTQYRRFKAQIVLGVFKEINTGAQIASEHQLHPNLETKWKQKPSPTCPSSSGEEHAGAPLGSQEQKVAQLYEQIGRSITQLAWLGKSGLESDP